MSEQNQQPFRNREEELEYVSRQIGEVREALREILGRVNQIERHVKRAFGVSSSAPPSKTKRSNAGASVSGGATIPPENVRRVFDDLTRMWKEESPDSVETRLRSMSIPDLKVMGHELGLSFRSKPSRKALVSGIIGRVNESLMLSRNTNLTQPRSQTAPSESELPSGREKGG